jgi:hypothetical protein
MRQGINKQSLLSITKRSQITNTCLSGKSLCNEYIICSRTCYLSKFTPNSAVCITFVSAYPVVVTCDGSTYNTHDGNQLFKTLQTPSKRTLSTCILHFHLSLLQLRAAASVLTPLCLLTSHTLLTTFVYKTNSNSPPIWLSEPTLPGDRLGSNVWYAKRSKLDQWKMRSFKKGHVRPQVQSSPVRAIGHSPESATPQFMEGNSREFESFELVSHFLV